MPFFDLNAARKAGHDDTTLLEGLAGQVKGFDLNAARNAGYDDTTLLEGLRDHQYRIEFKALNPSATEEDLDYLTRDKIKTISQPRQTRAENIETRVKNYKESGSSDIGAKHAAGFDVALEDKFNAKHPDIYTPLRGDVAALGAEKNSQWLKSTYADRDRNYVLGQRAEDNPNLAAMARGTASIGSGLIGAAEWMYNVAPNVARSLGGNKDNINMRLPWLSDMADNMEKTAKSLQTELSSSSFADAYDSGQTAEWMGTKFLENLPQMAGNIAAIANPAVAPWYLGSMAATSGGGQYRNLINKGIPGDIAALAGLGYGAVEAVSEKMGIEAAKPLLKWYQSLPIKLQANIGMRLAVGAGLVPAVAVPEGGEEIIAQGGQNLIDMATGLAADGQAPESVTNELKNRKFTEGFLDSFMGGVASGAGMGVGLGGMTASGLMQREPNSQIAQGLANEPIADNTITPETPIPNADTTAAPDAVSTQGVPAQPSVTERPLAGLSDFETFLQEERADVQQRRMGIVEKQAATQQAEIQRRMESELETADARVQGDMQRTAQERRIADIEQAMRSPNPMAAFADLRASQDLPILPEDVSIIKRRMGQNDAFQALPEGVEPSLPNEARNLVPERRDPVQSQPTKDRIQKARRMLQQNGMRINKAGTHIVDRNGGKHMALQDGEADQLKGATNAEDQRTATQKLPASDQGGSDNQEGSGSLVRGRMEQPGPADAGTLEGRQRPDVPMGDTTDADVQGVTTTAKPLPESGSNQPVTQAEIASLPVESAARTLDEEGRATDGKPIKPDVVPSILKPLTGERLAPQPSQPAQKEGQTQGQEGKTKRPYADSDEREAAIDRLKQIADDRGLNNQRNIRESAEYGASEAEIQSAIDRGEDALEELANTAFKRNNGLKQGFGPGNNDAYIRANMKPQSEREKTVESLLGRGLYELQESDRARLLKSAKVKSVDAFEDIALADRKAIIEKWLDAQVTTQADTKTDEVSTPAEAKADAKLVPVEYRYAMYNRPAGLGTIPKEGFIRSEPRPAKGDAHHDYARNGIAVFNRKLTDEETKNFEMSPMLEQADMDDLAGTVAERLREYASYYLEVNADEFNRTVRSAIREEAKGYQPSIADMDAFHELVKSKLRSDATVAETQTADMVEAVEEDQGDFEQDVTEQLARFESGDFKLPGNVSYNMTGTAEEKQAAKDAAKAANVTRTKAYVEAAKRFIEGDMTAKKPGKRDTMLDTDMVEWASPKPISKAVKRAKTTDEAITALHKIAANGDIRYYLDGVHVEGDTLVATDGHRAAAVADMDTSGLPAKPDNQEKGRSYTVLNRHFGNKKGGKPGAEPNVRWIDGRFPDWKRVMPEKHGVMMFLGTTQTGDYARGVAKTNDYVYSYNNLGVGIPINIGGTTRTFNAKYIVDAMDLFRAFGYDTVQVSYPQQEGSLDGSIYISSPDGKVRQVVMSMRGNPVTFSPVVAERDSGTASKANAKTKLAAEVSRAKNPAPTKSGNIAGLQKAPDSAERFEAGSKLTKEERKSVLNTLTDVYRSKRADKEDRIAKNGETYLAYPHQPELFEKSDITGKMVRFYVTLPDGRIAHPTELFPDYSQADVDRAIAKQVDEDRVADKNKKYRLETLNRRMADSLNEANRIFNKENPGYDYVPAILTDGKQFIRTAPENADKDVELLGGDWRIQDSAERTEAKPADTQAKQDKIEDDNLFSTIQTKETDKGVALFSRNAGQGIAQRDAQAIVDIFKSVNRNAPQIIVLDDVSKAPESLLKEIEAADAMNDVEGAFHKGSIYLFPQNIESAERAAAVLTHEGRHFAFKAMKGRALDSILMDIYNTNERVRRLADGKKSSLEITSLVEATEEALADIDPDTLQGLKGWKPLIAHFRLKMREFSVALRKAGLTAVSDWLQSKLNGWTDADVAAMLRNSDRFVRSGNGQGDGRTMLQRVFHGTPHTFMPEPGFPHGRPRLDKIGTGEGAQAYGWGWYSAESEGVAQSYQDMAKRDLINYAGPDRVKWAAGQLSSRIKYEDIVDGLVLLGVDSSKTDRVMRDAMSMLRDLGSIYQLDIPDATLQHLLDWDKTLGEQTPEVQNALESSDHVARGTGEDIYIRISNRLGGMKSASEYLSSIGIVGNRYLDGQSRNRPLKDIKREFLAELTEDADFDEVSDLIGTGRFSPKNDALIKALRDDEWLGFDYPAQAISAALSKDLGNYDTSPALLRAVADAQEGATFNFVIWDQPTLDKIALLERNGEKLDAIREAETRMSRKGDTITLDGIERPTTNSNGNPIAQTEEGLRNFWKWFGDSKVVDEQGRPLVVYHGSEVAGIAEFDTSKSRDIGTHFSTTDLSEKFGGNKYIAYLKIENPAEVSDIFSIDGSDTDVYAKMVPGSIDNALGLMSSDAEALIALGKNVERQWDESREADNTNKPAYKAFWKKVRSLAKQEGIDGFEYENIYEGGGISYAVFDNTQIKSATDNQGTFDSTNPDTRFSRRQVIGDSGRARTPEQEKMFRNVGREVNVDSTLDKIKKLADLKWTQGIFDQFEPIKELSQYAYRTARLSKGSAGAFDALMNHGKLSIVDGAYDADQSGGVMDKVFYPLGRESTDFLYWIAGNRADRLMQEEREHLFTDDDIIAALTLAEGTTDFDYTLLNGTTTRDRQSIYEDSLKKFNEFNRNVMDMAEQSGLIDPVSRKYWEHEFYVPFYRVNEDEQGGFRGMNMKQGIVRQQAFKQLKGGKEGLNDLLANTLMNWAHLIDASVKNRAAAATIESAVQVGAARPAKNGEKKTVWYMGDITKQVPEGTQYEENGVTLTAGPNTFITYVGKKEYVVDDPALMVAIEGLDFAGFRGIAMDILSKPKHYLTIGVTASPFYKIRNLIRDTVQSIAVAPLSYNPGNNLAQGRKLAKTDQAMSNFGKELVNMVTAGKAGLKQKNETTPEYVSALAAGGLIRFGTMLEGNDASRTRQLIKQGANDAHILDSENKFRQFYDKYLEPSIAAYNELGNKGEEVNRIALYDQLVKGGMSKAEAAFMARDLMDFSLQGSFTTIRMLAQLVPFFNSRLQGLYKLGRAFKEDRARMSYVVGAVIMASLALLTAYGDDDDWKKREDWDRDNYWWFKIGGTAFRIPKPFEIGVIGTLAERSAELMFSDEMTGKRFRKVTTSLIANQLSMDPTPQVFKPIIDIYANKDSFSKRPIETMGMERLDPEYRFNSSTSMVARGVSTATGGFVSPVQVDHLVRGYFAWLGTFIVSGTDMLIRAASDEPTRPALDMFKLASGGLVAEVDSGSSRYVSQMYDQAAELETAYSTWRALKKAGKREEAAEYKKDNLDKIRKRDKVADAKERVSEQNKRIRKIEQSDLSPEEKRQRILKIRKMQNEVARALVSR